MITEKVVKNKWFWAWQEEKEEQWLAKMSEQGLHLKQVEFLGRYTFEIGQPKKYVYQMDFITQWKERNAYFQLFADAGWEHLAEFGGWQYFKKPAIDTSKEAIFTNVESKAKKYQRVLWFLLVIILIYIMPFNIPYGILEDAPALNVVIFFLWAFILAVLIFGCVKIYQRIRQLKSTYKQ